MRTLQEKYNGINEGKFTKDQFLRDARMEQPSLVTQYNGYDDAVKILKNRGMIRETYSTEESFKDYSDDALADMIINSSRYEGNEEIIARVRQELARRKEGIKEWSPYGSMAFSGEREQEKEKAPLSSLEVGDLVYVKGVSGDYVVVKDKKEDGTVGVGHPHNDRISYQDGNKEAEVIKRANLKEAKKEEKKELATVSHVKKLVQAAKEGNKSKKSILAGFAGADINYKVTTASPDVIKWHYDKYGANLSGEIKLKPEQLDEARLTNKSLTDYRYKPTNDMDKYPYEQILRGLRVELEGLNILGTPTPEEYKKALGKVLKNLEKDTIFYTNQVAGVSKKVDLHDKMVDVKKDNAVDKFNGLKKAQLKEAIKGVIKNILSENSDPDLYDQDEERDGRRFVYNDQGDFGLESEFGDSFDNLDPDFEGGIDEEVYEMYGSGKRIPDDTYIGDDTWYQDDEIDYDDENFSDPLIDGDEADDIPHPRGYEEASDEEDFDDLFEGNKSEKELRAEWEKYQATCHPEDKMSYMEWRSEQGLDESISLKDIL